MITLDSFSALGEPQRALIDDVRAGRAPHAALITGIAGTGKRTLARLLACALLCTSDGAKPCMQCKGCRRAQAMTHPDLLLPSTKEKDRTIKVEDLREIIRALSYHASEGTRRVVLIENAQRMTPQSQNALLKSLEEPDGETIFLLTSSGETGLLPTVRSRCRVVRVQPWSHEQIISALLDRGVKEDRARELSKLCGGSLGTALDMDGDEDYFALRALCGRTFFSIRSRQDVPLASALLKDKKDSADEILSLVELKVREYLLYTMRAGDAPDPMAESRCHEKWQSAAPRSLENIMSALIDARKYRASNVSWQAIAEKLLYIISEEINL
ncbi:MAG: DNA polymerase III subunit delta' [Clostridia bacterium]|nr:DNA polymerase III subunit delta' [Clostridia bacterium]